MTVWVRVLSVPDTLYFVAVIVMMTIMMMIINIFKMISRAVPLSLFLQKEIFL